jgi:Macrocin-O-methyltransferase (TylF)
MVPRVTPPAPLQDVSPVTHDPKTQTPADVESRAALEDYFTQSVGTATEKLENFAKYVPRQSMARFLARYELFKMVQDVQGSIVECGVLWGGGLLGFAKFSAILEPYNLQRKIIGFDTFSGFPAIHDADRAGTDKWRSSYIVEGGLATPDGTYEDVLRAIEVFDSNRFLNHITKVEVVRGDFRTTGPAFLEQHPHLVVSLLYLDFDIYEPTRVALETFLPRIPRGGLVVFDELNDEALPGETVAALELLELSQLRLRRFPFEPRISYAVIGE